MSAEIPAQFTHSVKLEETAKGVRISVHIYANGRNAMSEAVFVYQDTRKLCGEKDIPLAPMEVSEK